MHIKKHIVILMLFAVSLFGAGYRESCTQERKKVIPVRLMKATDFDKDTWFDVNKIRMNVTNRGSYCWDWITGNGGLEYPKGSGKLAIFAASIWIFGYIDSELRGPMVDYGTEYGPGIMKNGTYVPDNPDFQVYKINKGDAENNPDWVHWKNTGVNYGAPVDDSGSPLLIGDQTLWTVFNDANPELHTDGSGGTLPLGIEVRMTVFGFDRKSPLEHMVFIKWEIENKGENFIEDAYIGLWFDPDLGDAFNDLVGCDPEINLGYCYNADNNDGVYGGTAAAAVGVDILQGALDPDGNRLTMTSFGKYIGGTDPRNVFEADYYVRGKNFKGQYHTDPVTGQETSYYANGDPVTSTGWVDKAPADRRMVPGTGPFNMQPGDKQEIIAAIIAAEGNDNLNSLSVLRHYDKYAKVMYVSNFYLYDKMPSPKVNSQAFNEEILLHWDNKAETYESKGYKFEGYNIYQLENPESEYKESWKLINSFDIKNDLRVIRDNVIDEKYGTVKEEIIQVLQNEGIQNYIRIDKDYLSGERELTNGNPYHYVVRAFAYNENKMPKMIESDFTPVTVIPSGTFPGHEFDKSQLHIEVTYSKINDALPSTDDSVAVTVVNPADLTGHQYKVIFNYLESPFIIHDKPAFSLWHLIDITDNFNTVLSNQWNKTGNENYPITDGFMVKVTGSSFPELENVGTTIWYNTGESNSTRGRFLYGSADYGSYYFGSSINPETDYQEIVPVEIRFSTENMQCAYFYKMNGTFTSYNLVPFTVWDTKNNRQLNCAVLEDERGNTYDGEWKTYKDKKQEEPILVFSSNYSEISLDFYTGRNIKSSADETDILYFYDWSFYKGTEISDGCKIMYVLTAPGSENDEFYFTAEQPAVDVTLAKSDFKNNIRAVPNPYYLTSLYESNNRERQIMFTGLPEKCTIRIFNLAGIKIREIKKDEPVSYKFWDLKNEYNTPVSSGIYIYVVESKELGQAMGKMALFMESRY